MKQGVEDLISGIMTYVDNAIAKSGNLIMRGCQIKSYDSITHFYTGVIDNIEYNRIQSISSTIYNSGDVVKVLANNYKKVLNNITIIGKVQQEAYNGINYTNFRKTFGV